MFKGEFELLSEVERQYQCNVQPILTYGDAEHIPEKWRAVDNRKLVQSFIEMGYASCTSRDLMDEGAMLEILPKGRDALQRYREHEALIKHENNEAARSIILLVLTALSFLCAVAAIIFRCN